MPISEETIKSLKEKYALKINNFIKNYDELIKTSIKILFMRGALSSSRQLNKDQSIKPNSDELQIFYSLVSENIKGVEQDMRKEISTQLNIGLSNRETKKELLERLDSIFEKSNPTRLKYENRLKLILRTESVRIYNAGAQNNAKRLGAKKKYLIGVSDNREGKDSKIANNKYGSPENAIPIDEPFEYFFKGQKRKFQFPPDRPNDRGTVIYLFD